MSTISALRKGIALLIVLTVIAAACGGDDSGQVSESSTTTTVAADVPATTVAPTDSVDDQPDPDPPANPYEGDLVGLFSLDPTECSEAGSESGSYFRMVAIGGTVEDGPYVPNGDSMCADQTFISLAPGTDGGLITGSLQPGEDPLFDVDLNATATRIAAPTTFFGVDFGVATTDEAPAPQIAAAGGQLSGNLAAVSAYYAEQIFNQGSPKPDGSTPGITTAGAVGTIDTDTGVYILEWASQIVGGSFNDFTGIWHFEGTFTPGS